MTSCTVIYFNFRSETGKHTVSVYAGGCVCGGGGGGGGSVTSGCWVVYLYVCVVGGVKIILRYKVVL